MSIISISKEEALSMGYDFELLEPSYSLRSLGVSKAIGVITKYSGSGIKIALPDYIDNHPVVSIGRQAFSQMEITDVVLPTTLLEIQESAFELTSLKEIEFPKELKHIGANAFSYSDLTNVEIPASVKYIGFGAFISDSLKEVIVLSTDAYFENKVFQELESQKVTVKGYVGSTVERHTFAWKNNFEAINDEPTNFEPKNSSIF